MGTEKKNQKGMWKISFEQQVEKYPMLNATCHHILDALKDIVLISVIITSLQ